MELQPDYRFVAKVLWRLVCHKIRQHLLTYKETVIRTTLNGRVRGIKRGTVYGKTYFSFEGIPFAKPPIGKLRFRAPQPPDSWEDVRDCTNARAKPIQKHLLFKFVEGSEDCLYLNIYAKELNTPKPLPVIVWIHGGGYQIGEGSRDFYSPDYFMEKEVIVVTITYRMGAFGFLSFDDAKLDVPGNASLKDQIMALQWIKENIQNFNGDPHNITAIGQSAGALSLHWIMCCERARGLFHKAILMSCTAFSNFATFPQHNWAYRLAYELGYTGENNDAEVLAFLENTDASRIANIHSFIMNKQDRLKGCNAPFGPIIERYATDQAVILKPIAELLKNAWGNELPVIMGATTFEGLLMYGNTKKYPYMINELNDCTDVVPKVVQKSCKDEEIKDMGLRIKKFYFNNEQPNIDRHLFKYVELMGDYLLVHGVHRGLLARLKYAPSQPTFYYRFDYDAVDFNGYRLLWLPSNIRGVIHSSDLSYLFYNFFSWKLAEQSAEYKVMKTMIGMFTAFAYNGNPNCQEIAPTKWSPVNDCPLNKLKCLHIAENVTMIDEPEQGKMDLWDSFYEKIKWP